MSDIEMDLDILIEDDDDILSDGDFLEDDNEDNYEENGDDSGEETPDEITEDIEDDLLSDVEEDFDFVKSKTVPRLTKYEKTNIIGLRATQIQVGAPPLIDIKTLKEITPIKIAEEELKLHKLDFLKVKRILPSGKEEIIGLKHMKY